LSPPRTISSHQLGRLGERVARDYLEKRKCRVLAHGFRLLGGEIDLIACEGDTLVFVEVKARRAGSLGHPEDSVDWKKQEQLRKLASAYLAVNGLEEAECRFDVISVVFDEALKPSLVHIRDAF